MATIAGGTDADRLAGTRFTDLILGTDPALLPAATPGFTTVVAGGLGTAVFAAAMPGDGALFAVLDKAGVIRMADAATGQISPFLDIRAEVDPSGEQGLLGIAFHPDFWANGRFYVFFSNLAGDSVGREYGVDPADPGTVLAGSGRDILTIPQPGTATNHKAGWIGFGPDGMLHVASGDGGPGRDPNGTGQDPSDLLGAILRIDVDTDGFPGDATRNYAIPADNPFVDGGGAPEVWAYGLRNPFRAGFDRGDGRLWIGDVGQGRQEEIDIGAPGANFGWSLYEGELTFPDGLPAGTLPPGITGPVHAYGREEGDRSVTGGLVHRGPDSGLHGSYVFGDFASGRVWTLADPDGDGSFTRTELDDGGLVGPSQLAGFAEDGEGRLYLVTLDGRLLRLDAGSAAPGAEGDDTVLAGAGDDRAFGFAGADSLLGQTGDDLLSSMEGADSLLGGGGADTLLGGDGADLLAGGTEDDLMQGGAGADRILGGDGADVLLGGLGADRLFGGAGVDRFRWTTADDSSRAGGIDAVRDFDGAAGDRLDASALVPGRFAFVGEAGFEASGAQLRVVQQGAGPAWRVELSLDGGPADMLIVVHATAALTEADFIL